MELISTTRRLIEKVSALRYDQKTVGLVPTMGYLHEGHRSLLLRSVAENDITIMTLFVNPTQFGANEDLSTYPRDLERDLELARHAGVDIVFAPDNDQMYPDGSATWVEVDSPITTVLCGASRPGHFRGVTTIVTKLFGLVMPRRAYFGEKDFQQLAIIRRMTADLFLPIEIIGCPIVRESDGLAMSSRNSYLNPIQRRKGLYLSRAIAHAQELVRQGERNAHALRTALVDILPDDPEMRIDYIECVDTLTLQPLETLTCSCRLILAVYVDTTRLIDNAPLTIPTTETKE
ncbi:pantoate--beta-alanine ligase [Chrysiogenes arsenatis]|uniref:pantoate--beta-alanine ligase n=1 Tax=Chrysiogenes arsenatis TaxID=309797 RepID=UPI00040EBD3D|nr:pantoate--beta-alanine ligase [Chrysiogenes arsenatis]